MLPLLGGSPAVWNTCLMYFQALLLLGYLYAHASTRYLSLRNQVLLHTGLLAVCFFALPVSVPQGWTPPTSGNVIPWLLLVLSVALGAPFIVVAATAPLLQRWLAGLDRPVENPYALYAASNAGSFIGLLAFPFILEPRLRLGEQSRLWTGVYLIAFALVAACGVMAWKRTSSHVAPAPSLGDSEATAPDWWDRMRWTALAFVPSSLLLGVTTFLSTDVASVPLLWVVPLSLYLLTFVIVFGRGGRRVSGPAALLHAVLVTLLAIVFFWQSSLGFRWGHALHLGVFTLTALVLHGELAASRPSPVHLTEYYLWMALGGALGGAFTALVVPLLFESTRDYLAMVVIACFLRPSVRRIAPGIVAGIPPMALVIVPALILAIVSRYDLEVHRILGVSVLRIVSVTAAAIVVLQSHRALRFGASIAAIAVAGLFFQHSRETIFSDRSFFGIYRVIKTAGPTNFLYHGTTIHGAQFTDAKRRLTPLTYYHVNGPVGQVFRSLQQDLNGRSVGVVGLGAGTMLCYARPGEQWTFFEIDPHVEAIARNPRLFTFLSACLVKPRIVIGDARLTLAREPSARYSLLVLDAFSSDAIPVHLLTREALALYSRVLSGRGVLLVHISNRRLDLEPVVGALAADAGFMALIRNHDVIKSRQDKELEYGSDWVVMAKRSEDLGALAGDSRWRRLRTAPKSEPWTDDYSNLISVIEW